MNQAKELLNELSKEILNNIDYLEIKKWQEFHPNGQIWIDGYIAVIKEQKKHFYNYLTGFDGYQGKPVSRLSLWTKYYNNGQIHWQINYGDGSWSWQENKETKTVYPQYREDGTEIIFY